MHRWSDYTAIPDDIGRSVVTLGNFDGVHRGHRAVLSRTVETARERGLAAVAVTFDPHPVAVLRPEAAPGMITSTAHRLELLQQAGLDAVLVMEFTRELATWTPEEFVTRVFVEALKVEVVVVGADTRFGVRNSGDITTLRQLGQTHGFEVRVVHDVGGQDNQDRWSSTQVRTLIGQGQVEAASEVLGRPHRVEGTVVHGDHRGRELGYPTANLSQDSDGLIPADGVYAGWLLRPNLPAKHPDSRLPAAISIGTNPTFDGTQRRVEAYVLDRSDLDLYGEHVSVEFVQHLRPTLRFDGVEALLERMRIDVAQCRRVLAEDS
ncbi:bifunctional riboflavin kinase/FAD synthetase [Gephyromycinifex aptenodytis]|uniref:bifunctional riboflavin kinase/FAD synthetase n=1 Tax=Gephyromycinifex aptenodytis TaxID=2716227 RepID=UPI001444BD04|nr:bifunctional riboflavin kinase/FAD synthetase [Gephyromycinifex aptenodytis]